MDIIATNSVAQYDSPDTHSGELRHSLNICLLGYRSEPLSGGQGIYLHFLSKALVDMGHSVDVISGPPYPVLDKRVNLIKLQSLDLYRFFPDMWKQFDMSYFRSWTALYEYISIVSGGFPEAKTFGRRVVKYFKSQQPKYDVVHDNQSLCYGLMGLKNLGYPVVATFHHPITRDLKLALDNEPSFAKRLMIKRWHSFLGMQKKVLKQLDYVATVSDASRRDISADFDIHEDRLRLIFNGIDTDTFVPPAQPIREARRLMCTSSSDAPLKGLKYLLQSFAELLTTHPDLRLTLVGKPRPDGENQKLIDSLGIGYAIDRRWDLTTEEMVAEYQRATIVVCPSLYEGFGLPAGEAMACGAPVITASGGALPEVVGDAGIIVPTRSVKALTQAISALIKDEEMRARLSIEGRQRILSEFSWVRAAERFTEFYQEAMNAHR